MNENELKEAWKQGGIELERNGGSGIFCDSTRRTPLEKLALRYKRFSVMGVVCILLGLSWLNIPDLQLKNRILTVVFYCLMMLICAVTDRYLYMKLSSINISSTPTARVIETVRKCRKIHLIFICFSIPMAIALIGFIAWQFSNSIYMLICIIVGAVTGLVIGIFQLMEFLRDYRDLLND